MQREIVRSEKEHKTGREKNKDLFWIKIACSIWKHS